jgi:hypothetical protein
MEMDTPLAGPDFFPFKNVADMFSGEANNRYQVPFTGQQDHNYPRDTKRSKNIDKEGQFSYGKSKNTTSIKQGEADTGPFTRGGAHCREKGRHIERGGYTTREHRDLDKEVCKKKGRHI